MKRFIECLLPTTVCNLKCSYCYINQEKREPLSLKLKYAPEHIGRALSIERLGGRSYISITASGETLIPKEIVDIAYHVLKQGHFLNLTTNGTINKRFEQLINFPQEYRERMHFSFSFHYSELFEKKLLDQFFANIDRVKAAGCSFLVQLNPVDEYFDKWEHILSLVENRVGAKPQLAITRDESTVPFSFFSKKKDCEYIELASKAKSPLFDFTLKNFNVSRREFCYAGEWSGKLYLDTGVLLPCYGFARGQNIFDKLDQPINFEAIGRNCKMPYCVNSSHFMSLGIIPTISTPSYADLRDRPNAGWYTSRMRNFLDERLYQDNHQYTFWQQAIVNIKYFVYRFAPLPFRFLRKAAKVLVPKMKMSGVRSCSKDADK